MNILRKMWIVLIYTGLVVCVSQAAEMNLPEDTSALLVAKELRISGNTLISTEHLLEFMPDIYNASDQRLSEAAPEHLYDLRVIRQIIAEPGMPRQVSIRTIQGLTQYILSVYKDADYSGIYVYVPEGAIRNNITLVNQVLPINILEAPVSEVRIKYYDAKRNEIEEGYLKRSALEKWSPVKRDKVAGQRSMDYLVNLLNLNPDRHVSAIVSRGEEPNSLAIQYDVYETRPWHFFAQVDNSGTNDREWAPKFGVINTNLTGIDDRFTALYQFSADSNFDDNYSVFGSYDFPVTGPRLRLNVFGGYSEFDIDPEGGPIDFIGNGSFYGAVLRYNILQQRGWFLDATGSLSHEESKITPSLFPQFFASDVKMNLWGVGANVHRRDDTSSTAMTLNYSENFGGSDQDEFWDSATFTGARTNAERDFSIISLTGNHSQYLDREKVQQLRGTAKWIEPTERLVPAKMTSFGGMYSIRGYDEYEIVADGGILASVQYEFDLIRHGQATETEVIANEDIRKLAPLAFLDFGRTKIKDPVAGEDKNTTLCSIGVGTVFEIGNNFSGAIYYGYPLKKTISTRKGKGRLSASAMLRW